MVVSAVMGTGKNAKEQEREMGINLIKTARQVGVNGFIYISVFRSDQQTGIPHFDVKAEIENLLKLSGLNFNILRPATFMDGLFIPWFLQPVKERNTIVSPMARDIKISYVHTLDIAKVILYALEHHLWNETYTFGGHALSIADLQEILSEKTGSSIAYQQLSLEQVEQAVGRDIALMVDYFNKNGFEITDNHLPKGHFPTFRTF